MLLAEGLDFEAFFGAGLGFFLCAFILLDTRYIHTSLGRLCWDSSFENAGTHRAKEMNITIMLARAAAFLLKPVGEL